MTNHIPTMALLAEVLRRIDHYEDERVMAFSVAELRRRSQDWDVAYAAHPATKDLCARVGAVDVAELARLIEAAAAADENGVQR